ncbi:DUF4760 domain-containing protein [Leifsonia sp. fls2-241-R2A-40a]|uniref:DUF4760 domain-containing protein n=1 Tax=Leifsonia sp. fls2-241-R2A-40a TaxID=3040290 RepID=UPI00254BBD30|nr:DUF4760 domain-containing protein [Leifsonia sp. fls2-241-R2A-40a]
MLILKDFNLGPAWTWAATFAPVFAVVIALASFVLLSLTSWANWRSARRQATIEAWNDWSEGCTEARRRLSQTLGMRTISPDQARALATQGETLFDRDGKPISHDDKQAVLNDVVEVLNGLERLAVGVRLGLYRREVLVLVGATIIKRTYERFEPYITFRRTSPDSDKRQERAFSQLDLLVGHIRQNEVDSQRLRSLRD